MQEQLGQIHMVDETVLMSCLEHNRPERSILEMYHFGSMLIECRQRIGVGSVGEMHLTVAQGMVTMSSYCSLEKM